jgi:hypothetical protein
MDTLFSCRFRQAVLAGINNLGSMIDMDILRAEAAIWDV